ncbi:MAG: penicillin-binding protein 2 [Bdellovibrionaceae bacterium]|jgi:cell division protein FtsI (penicillin-binding protein 3)|nr:penicillin-binding protein 2 [Pseudobdellovibrionaceae bacterium]
MKGRIVFIFVSIVFLWGGLVFRSAQLQVFPDQKFIKLKKHQYKKMITVNPRRGDIYDRNHKELATTIPAYSLFVDPYILNNKKNNYKRIARKLARITRVSQRKILKKLKAKNSKGKLKRFVWIKRRISEDLKHKINKLKLRGLGFIEEPLRVYPNDHLLSQVIGYVGKSGKGLEGVELKFNNHLSGDPIKVALQKDARGRPLVLDGAVFSKRPAGKDLELTVDSEIQFYLEKELEKSVIKFEADSAQGIVLDAQTSEIIAMANVPRFNNNKPDHYLPSYRRNRVVTDALEPGSTMKSVVIASALQSGIIKPNTKINCENGKLKVGRRTISEADDTHNFKQLTVNEVLSLSSNVGTSKIAFKMGQKSLLNSLKRFGFGKKTGVDLVGESKGLLSEKKWSQHQLASISFGHGVSATMLQMANAYAAIANGGILNQPTIIKKDYVGSKRPAGKRIISESVSKTMRIMLNFATAKGSTGYNARVAGYQVAGKTGTAQKVDFIKGGYERGKYIAGFAGFIPAHDPKYVVYVTVDNPQKSYYGSTVAAPIFSKVAGFAIRKQGLAPMLLSEKHFTKMPKFFNESPFGKSKNVELKKGEVLGEDESLLTLKGLSLRAAIRQLDAYDLKYKVIGQGRVKKIIPSNLDLARSKKRVKIYLE